MSSIAADLVELTSVSFVLGDYAGVSARALSGPLRRDARLISVPLDGSEPPTIWTLRPKYRRRGLLYAWVGVGAWVLYVGHFVGQLVESLI